ncbi:HAD family hydrolase [Porcincola sp. LCP21S3_C12]|uniref:HAD family hydrolase n=1 Tax=Porcincola sp. LCP21S3_C12 TaxID=3438798 RepID=UPI003F99C5C8
MKKADSRILTNKSAALFDLDGTLVDSMWMWTDIDLEYLSRFSGAEDCDIRALQRDIEGFSMPETAELFKTRFRIPDSLEQMQEDWNQMAYERYRTKVPLKAGARQLLETMRRKGMKLAVCTSNSRRLAETALQANDILGLFDRILTADEVGKGKPSPDIYLEAARQIGTVPARAIVFEDVISGAIAGKRAGMTVCGVADAYSEDRRMELVENCDYFIENFRELL